MHSKCSEICSVTSNSLPPHGLYGPRNFPGQNIGVRYFPSPGDLLNPGIEPRSPTLQADSLPTKPQGKPKNTRVGSLSLLQGIFPNQGSNPGLQPCRQILYHLSHKGSPQNKHYQIIISCHHMVMSIISLEVTGCKWAICPDARWSNPR